MKEKESVNVKLKKDKNLAEKAEQRGTDLLLVVVYCWPLLAVPGQSERRQHCSTAHTWIREDLNPPAEDNIAPHLNNQKN